jgi:hypothetical protein
MYFDSLEEALEFLNSSGKAWRERHAIRCTDDGFRIVEKGSHSDRTYYSRAA